MAAAAPRAALTRVDGHLHLRFHPPGDAVTVERCLVAYIERVCAGGLHTLPVPKERVATLKAAAGRR